MIVAKADGEAVEWVLRNCRPQDCVPYNEDSFALVRSAMDSVLFMERGGPPMMIAGISAIPGAPDIGHVWAVATDVARGSGVGLTKVARQTLKKWMERFNLTAVMSYTLLDSVENRRWMGMLDFEPITGPHSLVMDRDGISWKGYVRWASEKAGEAGDQLRARRHLISALYGNNTRDGKATSASAMKARLPAPARD